MRLNLLEPLPLKAESYDLIHARFLFLHVCAVAGSLFYFLVHFLPLQLRDPFAVLTRVIPLLKPGGWLLTEDGAFNADVQGDVPGTRAAYTALMQTFKGAGEESRYVVRLSSYLRETGVFGVVEAEHVSFPVNPLSNGTLSSRVCLECS
jgi:hypothetical protein